MIGRHSEMQVYRELFRSEDFLRALGGAVLIPIAFFLSQKQLGFLPSLTWGALLLLASMAVNGLPIVVEAAKGLWSRRINVDELVSIAILACLFEGYFLEGAIVCAIMVFGELVEEAVSDSARNSIRALVEVTPETAVRERDGVEETVKVRDVAVGDILVLRAGDTIPVDGVVIHGGTSVDESTITGESIPVPKVEGDEIFAGTTCVDGYIRIKTSRVGGDSTIGRITTMVQAAEQQKTESGKIVDRYAFWFTPAILTIAAATYILTGDVSRAITVLIVGCPCSFLLASPVTTVAAIGRAAKSGILVKGGRHLENVAVATGFFFDKTGTLTRGEPEIVEIQVHEDFDRDELLAMAAAVEKGSLHPLGQALVKEAEGLGMEIPHAEEIHTEAGRGIGGRIHGRRVRIETSRTPDARGHTNVDILVDDRLAGTIGFLDSPRETAPATVQGLLDVGVRDVVMISGDQEPSVRRVAQGVGITAYHAAQKPDQKLAVIRDYTGGPSVFVGDGINDAPALKTATTGIAMGLRGADVALETADIVLMNDRLDELPFLVRLGRRMSRVIKLNIFLSFAINVVSLVLSFDGVLTPILGAVTHNFGSILVVCLASSVRFTRDI